MIPVELCTIPEIFISIVIVKVTLFGVNARFLLIVKDEIRVELNEILMHVHEHIISLIVSKYSPLISIT